MTASITFEPAMLDNAAWWSLMTSHAPLAIGSGSARRFGGERSVFSGLEHVDGRIVPGAWDDLADLASPGDGALLVFTDSALEPPAAGWETTFELPGHQMILTDVDRLRSQAPGPERLPDDLRLRALTADDVPAMLELVALTEPGPFLARTIELGDYYGVVGPDGRLLAMAGERLRLPGHTELSAVCTHPDGRGRGLAAILSRRVVEGILARDETAMLHVADGNTSAIDLYDRLGFAHRATFVFRAEVLS